MDFSNIILDHLAGFIKENHDLDIDKSRLIINPTKKEFAGEYTVVIFPLVKQLKKAPEALGTELGDSLKTLEIIKNFNVVKGFLNLEFSDQFWVDQMDKVSNANYQKFDSKGEKVMVEFSSPNTNKPLHLGHIRNILLGDSCARIMERFGYEVIRTQIVNDRGIAVCKSMIAWQELGKGETPESSGIKGDHFVGKYYVAFDKAYREEYALWQESEEGKAVFKSKKNEGEDKAGFFKRYKNDFFNEYSKWGKKAKEMLLKWEDGEEETLALWRKMNGWVYDGFGTTYESLGVEFDKLYYESDTYLLGKSIVDEGLEKKLFYPKEDGSIWVDLTDAKMDEKIVLRGDGTSVYLTQDLGTAEVREKDYNPSKMIYVVGNEQDYHFKVLFEVMKRLGRPYADGLFHLSYGMVDLPEGRMKSREGTVVDADDLMREVKELANATAAERGELSEVSEEEKELIINQIGLSALKYYILKVQAKKRMVFNPNESLDMQGDTGPYILNAFVRIQSLFRKDSEEAVEASGSYFPNEIEKEVTRHLLGFRSTIKQASEQYDPSVIAQYTYTLAKMYHKFYHDNRILTAETNEAKLFRLKLSKSVGEYLNIGMNLLGIMMPERM